jgi:hypothetical protein
MSSPAICNNVVLATHNHHTFVMRGEGDSHVQGLTCGCRAVNALSGLDWLSRLRGKVSSPCDVMCVCVCVCVCVWVCVCQNL